MIEKIKSLIESLLVKVGLKKPVKKTRAKKVRRKVAAKKK